MAQIIIYIKIPQFGKYKKNRHTNVDEYKDALNIYLVLEHPHYLLGWLVHWIHLKFYSFEGVEDVVHYDQEYDNWNFVICGIQKDIPFISIFINLILCFCPVKNKNSESKIDYQCYFEHYKIIPHTRVENVVIPSKKPSKLTRIYHKRCKVDDQPHIDVFVETFLVYQVGILAICWIELLLWHL